LFFWFFFWGTPWAEGTAALFLRFVGGLLSFLQGHYLHGAFELPFTGKRSGRY
jgi:hypothetical protein